MTDQEKLDILNSMEAIDSDCGGGELVYVLVAYNEENKETLSKVVPDVEEYIKTLGDPDGYREAICIVGAAFEHANADYFFKGKFVIFNKEQLLEMYQDEFFKRNKLERELKSLKDNIKFAKSEKCNGHGNDDENISCPNCAGTGDGYRNPLLEEYVDCLHFILSIGNDIGCKSFKYIERVCFANNITGKFNAIFKLIGQWEVILLFLDDKSFKLVLLEFIELGQQLGFTWEQIEQAYIKKNEVNHQRQSEGY